MINEVIAGLPSDGTPAQYMGKALDLMMQYDIAYVKGSTILGLIDNPDKTTLSIFNNVTQINKNGNDLNIGLTKSLSVPIEGIPVIGSMKLKISTRNSLTITSATKSLISFDISGVKGGWIPISGARFTPTGISIKYGAWIDVIEY